MESAKGDNVCKQERKSDNHHGGKRGYYGKVIIVPWYNSFDGKEDHERHKGAHVHAWYQGHAASFDARTGRMLAKGKNGFPRKQAGWIKTWIEIHQDELSAAWEMLRLGMTPPEIAPLAR